MKKASLVIVSVPFILILWLWIWLPSVKEIKGCIKTTMYAVDLCPGSKNYVPLAQISKNIQNAILITEDSGFYSHNGFDLESIERCYEKFKQKNKIVCGGSTLTQQLAKNMFLNKEKSFFRKGLEALITIQMERNLTKKEIFERYLNVVQFGKNVYGVKQASQYYFQKPPGSLNVPEGAFLAMVLPNPDKYSQSFYRQDLTRFARKRLDQIIDRMQQYSRISSDDYVMAKDGLDSFLKPQSSFLSPDPIEELTEEDLDKMIEETKD